MTPYLLAFLCRFEDRIVCLESTITVDSASNGGFVEEWHGCASSHCRLENGDCPQLGLLLDVVRPENLSLLFDVVRPENLSICCFVCGGANKP